MNDALIARVVETYPTHTVAEQAILFGRSKGYILKLRSHALRAGLVSKHDRATFAYWAEGELERFISLYRKLMDAPRAARTIGRTYHAVLHELHARGMTLDSIRDGYAWTRRELALLFDVHDTTVALWIERKQLRAFRRKRYQQVMIRRDDVLRFFKVREAWPTYDPKRIKDLELATAARLVRNQAGGRWMRVQEYAERHYFAVDTIRARIRRGVFEGEAVRINGAYWIWFKY